MTTQDLIDLLKDIDPEGKALVYYGEYPFYMLVNRAVKDEEGDITLSV